ncbi:hypothetical protein J4573_39350 [Actinomadura barringtoniae]|uniref:histidine kinase n=1 Tax=Actinomadura barringtoniae TaxID=1427535 RepID=A0A939TEC4_9ACTN|nr:histidine kinase [Actinomadura barringtoniae]MBO2453205.1 hypothetical protein [Actinomadura barringtoniae]
MNGRPVLSPARDQTYVRVRDRLAGCLTPPARDRLAAITFSVPATLMMLNHADRGVAQALGLTAGAVLFSLAVALAARPLPSLGLLLTGLCLVGAVDPPSTMAGLVAFGYVLWPLASGSYAYAALALSLTCAWATALPDFRHRGAATAFTVLYLVIWTVGHTLGIQRRQARHRAEQAATEERLRIAREMHDLLAHGMSVITVQAGYGALIALDQPHQAQAALATIETAGRATLTELRALLQVLRPASTGIDMEPAPSLSDLPQLIERTAAAGVQAEVELNGTLDDLPASVGLSAYRITQEALTNVIKHAATEHAHLLITRTPADLTIKVSDNGNGPARGHRPGHGLLGMRERALTHGGTLEAVPLPQGGFQVTAILPLPT